MRVLDIENLNLRLSIGSFAREILVYLKKLTKFEYFNLDGQPSIPKFRYFLIYELPRLKYINWSPITKEELTESNELQSKGTWYDESLGFNNIKADTMKEEIDNTLEPVSPRTRKLTMGEAKLLAITSASPSLDDKRMSLYRLDSLLDTLENMDSGLEEKENQMEKDTWDLLGEFIDAKSPRSNPASPKSNFHDTEDIDLLISELNDSKLDEKSDWMFLDSYVEETLQQIEPKIISDDPLDAIINEFENGSNSKDFFDLISMENNERNTKHSKSDLKKQQKEEDLYVESLLKQNAFSRPKRVLQSNDPIISPLDKILAESEGLSNDSDINTKTQTETKIASQHTKPKQKAYDLDTALEELEFDAFDGSTENITTNESQPKSALSSLTSYLENMNVGSNVGTLDDILDQVERDPVAELDQIEEKYVKSSRSLKRGPRREKYIVPSSTDILNISMKSIDTLDVLGTGTWGETFEVMWNTDGQSSKHCTMKTINNSNSMELKSFQEELKTQMKVNHTNIAKTIGGGSDDNHFVLREFIQGSNIAEFLKNPPAAIQIPFIINISRQISDAINYLHSMNIIHGGLKPSNIIIDKHMKVWITDYGFLDIKDSLDIENASPEWMAPELIKGDTDYDEKIDSFSFGVLLYYLITSNLPYDITSPSIFINKVKNKGYVPSILDDKSIPPALERLILSCWRDDSTLRPSLEIINKILNAPIDRLLQYNNKPKVEPLVDQSTTFVANPTLYENESTTEIPIRSHVEDSKENFTKEDEIEEPFILSITIPSEAPLPITKKNDSNLSVDEERKISAILSKISDMLNTSNVEDINKAVVSLQAILSDKKRAGFVFKRVTIISDLLDILIANDLNTLSAMVFNNHAAFEMFENVMKTLELVISNETSNATMNRAVVVICGVLKSTGDYLKVLAARVLCTLAEYGKEEDIRKQGAMYTLISDLSRAHESITYNSLLALSNLLTMEQSRDDFITAGGLRKIKELNLGSNKLIAGAVNDVMVNFWDTEKAQDLLSKEPIKAYYVATLSGEDLSQYPRAIKAIQKIIGYEPNCFNSLDVLKILKGLQYYISQKTNKEKNDIAALELIAKIIQNEQNYDIFCDLGFVETILGNLSSAPLNTKIACSHIIIRILENARTVTAFFQQGVILVLSNLFSTSPQLRQSSFAIVKELVKDSIGQSHFISKGGLSRLVSIIAYSDDSSDVLLSLEILTVFAMKKEHLTEIRFLGGVVGLMRTSSYKPDKTRHISLYILGLLMEDNENSLYMVERNLMVKYLDSLKQEIRQNEKMDPFLKDTVKLCLNSISLLGQDKRYWRVLRESGSTEFINLIAPYEEFNDLIKGVIDVLSKDKKFVLSSNVKRALYQ